MPAANARTADLNQEPERRAFDINDPDDLAKFCNTFSAMAALLGSPEEGERHNAGDLSIDVLKKHGLHWVDIIDGYRLHVAAKAANTYLLAQIAALQAEIDQLRTERSNGNQNALWADVGTKLSNTAQIAQWALSLHAREPVGITRREVEFLQHMSRWPGRQTAKQEAWLRDIVVGVVRRTGKTPPSS